MLLQVEVWITKLMSSTSKESGGRLSIFHTPMFNSVCPAGLEKKLSSPLFPSLQVSAGLRKLSVTQFVLSVFRCRLLHFPLDSRYLASANVDLCF